MEQSKAVLYGLVLVFGALAALLVFPLVEYVFLALLVSYLLYPLHVRLAPRIGSRISALLLLLGAISIVLLPLFYLLVVAVDQAFTFVDTVARNGFDDAWLNDLLDMLLGPSALKEVQGALAGVTAERVPEWIGSDRATRLAFALLGGVTRGLIGITVFLFVTFYALVDGRRFVDWLQHVAPLSLEVQRELLSELDRMTYAVIVGNVAISVLQGVLTGIGLAAVGISNAVLWTVLAVLLALLPFVGAPLVWGPAAIYLFVSGNALAGAALFVYGAVFVGLSDNYLRPLLVNREARLNPAVVVVGLFGGVYLFGFVGLFVGPILLGVLKALLETVRRERSRTTM